ncbi:MAG: ATP-binding protein, partial [Planctomycetia bacterium]|nr:ATP-binding protein [Planctomycetia bacterium]
MIWNEILKGESHQLEFKKELSGDMKKILKTVCAFANGDGGKIVFGIENNTLAVAGIESDKVFILMDSLADMISNNCSPQIIPYITFETINDKTVVIVEIRPGQNTPYYLKSAGSLEGTYIRVGATTRKAESEKVQELILFGTHRSFDELITKDAEPVQKKDITALCKMISRYNGLDRPVTVDHLVSWKLLKREKNRYLPSVGFRLLTYNDLHFARIQCALFKGTDRTEFLDRKEFEGSLCDQIEEAYTFVLKHINKRSRINGLYREDIYELPLAAVREIIVNAVMHRNYLMHSCIQVSVFSDRLEIVSPGGLYAGLTKEEMLSGSSSIRNQRLADIFMKMRIVEKWGTGVLRVFRLCSEAGLARPKYTTEGDFVRVEIFRPGAEDDSRGEAPLPVRASARLPETRS